MYFISVFTQYDKTKKGFPPDIGSYRAVGYYTNKKAAIDAVLENRCDIFEYTYTYAVVEHIEPGLYNLAADRWFFKWNLETSQYEPIESFVDQYGNYAFG
jgi:hypothetical protein